MAPPAQDRDRNHLHPLVRPGVESFLQATKKAGFNVEVYETFRTAARQAYLFASGRPGIPGGYAGPILTNTLDSAHEYGLAVDVMVLQWNGRAWVANWSWSAYAAVFRTVPPSAHGLETLPWERPHLQLRGVNGAALVTPASVFARAHGIQANVIVGSKAPKPVPAKPPTTTLGYAAEAAKSAAKVSDIPAKPAGQPAPATRGRVMVPKVDGGYENAAGRRIVAASSGEEIIINALDQDIYLSGVYYYKG